MSALRDTHLKVLYKLADYVFLGLKLMTTGLLVNTL